MSSAQAPDQVMARGFVMDGGRMPTLAEVEEALRHARAVPAEERGAAWHSYVDGLLEQRVALAGTSAQKRETKVVQFSEAR